MCTSVSKRLLVPFAAVIAPAAAILAASTLMHWHLGATLVPVKLQLGARGFCLHFFSFRPVI